MISINIIHSNKQKNNNIIDEEDDSDYSYKDDEEDDSDYEPGKSDKKTKKSCITCNNSKESGFVKS